ncbi:hypothetical protein Q4I28_008315 [Leishmania naiffi]|uniref:Uncharacterized protein n=1 Tax=Leishmania naiffi TaxID=5678 RepID=A0AAW3B1U6_9TRYP
MSALNDSRNTSRCSFLGGISQPQRLQGTPSSLFRDDVGASSGGGGDGTCEFEVGFDCLHSSRSGEEDAADVASAREKRLSRVQRDVRRHEVQIAALLSERHKHCEHLATVYEELEKVLHKLRLEPLQDLKQDTGSSSSPMFCALTNDEEDCTPLSTASALAPSLQQRFQQVLQRHQDRVYEVLIDYRQQIDRHESETSRRLRAIEDTVTQIQSDVRELQHRTSTQIEDLQHFQQNLQQRVEAVAAQQEVQRTTIDAAGESRDTKATKLMSKIQEDVARLRADTKMVRTKQIQSDKEFGEQIRSLLSAQHKAEQTLEVHSASIVQLRNQDSLEGAFHEVKDWLGDLEKRMVSRGELLQWTESLQSEIHQIRRVASGALAHTVESVAPSQDA